MKYVIDVPEDIAKILEEHLTNDGVACELYTNIPREDIEEKVWEFAKSIICPSDCVIGSINRHRKEIFGVDSWEIRSIFTQNSFQEAWEKYKKWQRRKDDIKVGDEVFLVYQGNEKAVVTRLRKDDYDRSWVDTLRSDGKIGTFLKSNVSKTGVCYPEVTKLLEKMGDDDHGSNS